MGKDKKRVLLKLSSYGLTGGSIQMVVKIFIPWIPMLPLLPLILG